MTRKDTGTHVHNSTFNVTGDIEFRSPVNERKRALLHCSLNICVTCSMKLMLSNAVLASRNAKLPYLAWCYRDTSLKGSQRQHWITSACASVILTSMPALQLSKFTLALTIFVKHGIMARIPWWWLSQKKVLNCMLSSDSVFNSPNEF